MVSVFKFKGQGHDLVNFKVIFIKRKCSNTVQFVHTYGSHNKTNIFVKISYPKVKGQGHQRSLKCFSSLFLCKIMACHSHIFRTEDTKQGIKTLITPYFNSYI